MENTRIEDSHVAVKITISPQPRDHVIAEELFTPTYYQTC
ncbi:hypothetical protein COLO4_33130 [Corchorus olitorius]|uniref:Uncharacterized protein n=1 Tax=Corchorus olitorius TaxID=93759 RepID=A0A1R3GW01_9ROSI|nr:hypothetical protein COLO4_33130 [Corchorus olitorius]